jgi:hypothetical protein
MREKLLRLASFACLTVVTFIIVLFPYDNKDLAVPMVGFFTPRGILPELVDKTQFGMINIGSVEQVERSFAIAQGHPFLINVDLGPLVTSPAEPDSLSKFYRDSNGKLKTKIFQPSADNKLLRLPSDESLAKLLQPYLDILAKYPRNVGTVFVADEPYLNGISKKEMERAGRIVRNELDKRGLKHVKLGVTFASGMFDSSFAEMIDLESGSYVSDIDRYYLENQVHLTTSSDNAKAAEFERWVSTVEKSRLVTYDRAGNMYISGGIPEGYDVVAFDFYMSTILLERLHAHTLAWLAEHYPEAGCARFAGTDMASLRQTLSFFRQGAVVEDSQLTGNDRQMLDAIFQCRMEAVTAMLKKTLGSRKADLLLISESSNNGAFEFDPQGNIEQDQPMLLVESRVLDEVKRAEDFYNRHRSDFTAGLMFFTYENEYDHTIKLNIGGASKMPHVLDHILRFAFPDRDDEAFKIHGTDITPSRIECLFNWAERNYSRLAPTGYATKVWSIYTYRYYAAIDAYLGVSSVDNHVYYRGPDGKLQDEGHVSYWLPLAGCQ